MDILALWKTYAMPLAWFHTAPLVLPCLTLPLCTPLVTNLAPTCGMATLVMEASGPVLATATWSCRLAKIFARPPPSHGCHLLQLFLPLVGCALPGDGRGMLLRPPATPLVRMATTVLTMTLATPDTTRRALMEPLEPPPLRGALPRLRAETPYPALGLARAMVPSPAFAFPPIGTLFTVSPSWALGASATAALASMLSLVRVVRT